MTEGERKEAVFPILYKTANFVEGKQRHSDPKPIHQSLKLLPMFKGTVKFFNETKGYGFIVEEGTNQEVFVHVTGLIDKVRNGDTVTFETKRGKKGMTAVEVKLA